MSKQTCETIYVYSSWNFYVASMKYVSQIRCKQPHIVSVYYYIGFNLNGLFLKCLDIKQISLTLQLHIYMYVYIFVVFSLRNMWLTCSF